MEGGGGTYVLGRLRGSCGPLCPKPSKGGGLPKGLSMGWPWKGGGPMPLSIIMGPRGPSIMGPRGPPGPGKGGPSIIIGPCGPSIMGPLGPSIMGPLGPSIMGPLGPKGPRSGPPPKSGGPKGGPLSGGPKGGPLPGNPRPPRPLGKRSWGPILGGKGRPGEERGEEGVSVRRRVKFLLERRYIIM